MNDSPFTPETIRKALAYADRIDGLASRSPDGFTQQAAAKVSERVRRFYGLSDQAKKEIMLEAVRVGCFRYDDIAEEIDLPVEEVKRVTVLLIDDGTVKIARVVGACGGRPVTLVRAIGE